VRDEEKKLQGIEKGGRGGSVGGRKKKRRGIDRADRRRPQRQIKTLAHQKPKPRKRGIITIEKMGAIVKLRVARPTSILDTKDG